MASEDSLKDFINQFKISSQKNIVEYREELMEKLEKNSLIMLRGVTRIIGRLFYWD